MESDRVLRRMRTWYHLSLYEKFLVCDAVSLGVATKYISHAHYYNIVQYKCTPHNEMPSSVAIKYNSIIIMYSDQQLEVAVLLPWRRILVSYVCTRVLRMRNNHQL